MTITDSSAPIIATSTSAAAMVAPAAPPLSARALVVLEGASTVRAVKRAVEISSGHLLRILVLGVLTGIASLAILAVGRAFQLPPSLDIGVSTFLKILCAPIGSPLVVVAYVDIRGHRE